MTDGSPAETVVALADACRRRGVAVPLSATRHLAEALSVLGPRHVGDLYWAGRATLVCRPDDRAAYDDAFAAVLAAAALDDPGQDQGAEPAGVGVGAGAEGLGPVSPAAGATDGTDPGDDGTDPGGAATDPGGAATDPGDDGPDAGDDGTHSGAGTVRYSATETLRATDFADLDAATLDRLLASVVVRRSVRPSRRVRPHRRGRGPMDVARTARRSLRTEGEPFEAVRTARRVTARPVVVLIDVSGSMEPYAEAFLALAHHLRPGESRVEVFSFGTRLTRLTRALSSRHRAEAMRAAGAEVADWAGGTRLGTSLQRFIDEWGQPGMARGATVVIVSDGWDRGDPTHLGAQMARLGRLAHRVVWVNPLKATDGYAPLAGGMAAALPFVDAFVAGNTIEAIDELMEVIAR